MSTQRQINKIRTDYLENWIGFYLANGRGDEASVLVKLGNDINAPISAYQVNKMINFHLSDVIKNVLDEQKA